MNRLDKVQDPNYLENESKEDLMRCKIFYN